ncbi:MAG: hypothetical protein JW910_14950 [Anaerolineae bacterium]|nr:hypothetical protein [Anaerolineae bacterium]
MNREPDWEALSQLQFLLMRRVVEPLNAGLAAVSLVDMDQVAGKPRAYWQDRATRQVMSVLGLVNAWHALLRFKLGELLPHQHIRPFPVQELLDWLTYQLQSPEPFQAITNTVIEANRESLQEALLLLYSAAFTLGPQVNLLIESSESGVWFRVRYARRGANETCPANLDTLLERLSGNWRSEDAAFELRTAADFITLNGSHLHLQGTQYFCEMAFFIYALGKRPPEPLMTRQVIEPPPIELSAAQETLASYMEQTSQRDQTLPLPETLAEELTAIAKGESDQAEPEADSADEPRS